MSVIPGKKFQYRKFIEENFLIDEPKTGKLVPFAFNIAQNMYYDELCDVYDIENKGLDACIRDIILKARRMGFSSVILALFAAHDVMTTEPTETVVFSYKDDATKTFKRRYRVFVLSYFAKTMGYTIEMIQQQANLLDEVAKQVFDADGNDIIYRHNKAHFYCGTASARTGGRGGVVQKILYSEEAHYPDTPAMPAREIIDGTMRQVDVESGWVFRESTANGFGNYYESTWAAAVEGTSRFRSVFYGWKLFYTEDQYTLIASEFTDKSILRQEYPETPEDAFIASGSPYFDNDRVMYLLKEFAEDPIHKGHLYLEQTHDGYRYDFLEAGDGKVWIYELPKVGMTYTMGGDVAEGIESGGDASHEDDGGADFSVLDVIDNKTMRTVAKFKGRISPADLIDLSYALGMWYNYAYIGIESNKDGGWVNDGLFKMGYPNLYFREAIDDITKRVGRKIGFLTGGSNRNHVLSELQKHVLRETTMWNDKRALKEMLTFVKNKMGRPEAMSGKHDDQIMAKAIAFYIHSTAPPPVEDEAIITSQHIGSANNIVLERLKKRYKQHSTVPGQNRYV